MLSWPVFLQLLWLWHRYNEFYMPPLICEWSASSWTCYTGTPRTSLVADSSADWIQTVPACTQVPISHVSFCNSWLLTAIADVLSRSALCDAIRRNYVVPRTRLKLGERAFSVAPPQAWNWFLMELKMLHSAILFQRDLKTFLFQVAYNV